MKKFIGKLYIFLLAIIGVFMVACSPVDENKINDGGNIPDMEQTQNNQDDEQEPANNQGQENGGDSSNETNDNGSLNDGGGEDAGHKNHAEADIGKPLFH